MAYNEFEYLSESDIHSEFIPGGGVMSFVPGGEDGSSFGIPGKAIDNGKYIGLVRMWGEDRRVDRKLRIVNNELEEKMDYFFKGEQFFSDDWGSNVATWDEGVIRLPEGFNHTLRSYIELLITSWSYDDINEIWWEKYEEHY